MTEPSCPENIIDELAEEFACRRRAGEHPSVEEYVGRHPQWGAQIRAILSAVTLMERLKPERETPLPIGFLAGTSPPLLNQLGEFRIIREIGRGGMGIVYEAQQESLGRRVAIKVLPSHLVANENVRKRFHQEAQAAARLHHTNIVPVFGVGERDGLCFYVMQLIEGRGLDRVIRDAHSRTDHDDDPTEQWHDVPALDAAPTAPDGRALDKSASSDDPLADSQYPLISGQPAVLFRCGADRISGRRGAGVCAFAGRHSSGHQAGELVVGSSGKHLGNRFRGCQGCRRGRVDPVGRLDRHLEIHSPGTLRRPFGCPWRRVQPGHDPVRIVDAASSVSRNYAASAHPADYS